MRERSDMIDAKFDVFSDGAAAGNPGPGGYAAIVRCDGRPDAVITGAYAWTTNNRMELRAVLHALETLPNGARVVVHSDSRYVINGISTWIAGWRRRGWLTKQRTPVLNRDLWEALDRQASRLCLCFKWIKGHDGHRENERCDKLAVQASQSGKGVLDSGYGDAAVRS